MVAGLSKGVHIVDKDKGYRALVKTVFGFEKPVVSVGIHAAEGAKAYDGTNPATVVDVAGFHEFGLGVPERSWLRGWYDSTTTENKEFIRSRLLMVVQGKITKEQALEQIGLKFQTAIQERISDGIPPPNAASTIRQKGSSTPLIDTGQMRSSVTFSIKP